MLGLNSCNHNPQKINIGVENCSFCKMIISDNRFGAEAITQKGKIYKFDEIQCLLNFIKSEKENFKDADFYFTDFETKHDLIKSSGGFLLKSDALKSPMNGNIAAFSSKQSLQNALAKYSGQEVEWNELLK